MRIGVIGLGNIGGAIAANLLEDGHEVFVYDTDKSRAEPLAQAGAVQTGGPGEIAARSEITFTSLPSLYYLIIAKLIIFFSIWVSFWII